MSDNTTYFFHVQASFSTSNSDSVAKQHNFAFRQSKSVTFNTHRCAIARRRDSEWSRFGSNLEESLSQSTFLHSACWIGFHWFLHWTHLQTTLDCKRVAMLCHVLLLLLQYLTSKCLIRIIRLHQLQSQANATSQAQVQPAINYSRSLSFRFLLF